MPSFAVPACAAANAFCQMRERLGTAVRPPPGLEDVVPLPKCCLDAQPAKCRLDDTVSCHSTSTAADSQEAKPVLTLASALAEPAAPPPKLPSVGSAGHHLGLCKPCDFLHRSSEGCKAGANCKFCHLCGPDENKRRKANKRQILRNVRQFQQTVPPIPPMMAPPPGL